MLCYDDDDDDGDDDGDGGGGGGSDDGDDDDGGDGGGGGDDDDDDDSDHDDDDDSDDGDDYNDLSSFSVAMLPVCRSLGIPTRSITNFASAHDTDASMTIDFHTDEDGEPVSYLDDSVW